MQLLVSNTYWTYQAYVTNKFHHHNKTEIELKMALKSGKQ